MADSKNTTTLPEIRAYPVLGEIPEGCTLHYMMGSMHYPHICSGEFAIVDPRDRTFVQGEVYQVLQKSRFQTVQEPERRKLFQIKERAVNRDGHASRVYDFDVLNTWKILPNNEIDWDWHEKYGGPYIIGDPYTEDEMNDRIVGRVVGIYRPENSIPHMSQVSNLDEEVRRIYAAERAEFRDSVKRLAAYRASPAALPKPAGRAKPPRRRSA